MQDEAKALEDEMTKRHHEELASLEQKKREEEDANEAEEEGNKASASSSAAPGAPKPSRAQKRREAKAEKEAERDARIAMERAAIGETQGEIEESALEEQLRPLGFAIYDIPPDGHCMFRAIEDQVAIQQEEEEHSSARRTDAHLSFVSKTARAWALRTRQPTTLRYGRLHRNTSGNMPISSVPSSRDWPATTMPEIASKRKSSKLWGLLIPIPMLNTNVACCHF